MKARILSFALNSLLALILFMPIDIFTQDIVAGDLWVDSSFPTGYTQAFINIYRASTGDPQSLKIDWGDGVVDTTYEGVTTLSPFEDIVIDRYFADHEYLHPGLYEITVQDSFLVDDITNIENSGEKYLTLKNLLRIRGGGIPSSISQFDGLALSVSISDNGQIIHSGGHSITTFTLVDSITEKLVPFTDTDYSYPPASDTIICCDPLIWDRPTAPGRYAFGLQASTWYQGELLGTGTRKMIIDVDSSMIISSAHVTNSNELLLTLYPNPVREQLHILLGSISGNETLITIYDVNGIQMYQEDVTLSTRLETVTITVRNWPEGIYFLNVRENGRDVAARRFLVSN